MRMLHIVLVATAVVMGMPAPVRAEERQDASGQQAEPTIRASLARHLTAAAAFVDLDARDQPLAASVQGQPTTTTRSIIKRRPVLSGLLIGMAAGTAVAAAAWGNEGAFVGFYSGAAAGATLGWVLSR